jgi:chemotaxis protein histidine kinase CheA
MRKLSPEYQEQLDALRRLYLQQLREKADAIEEGWSSLAAGAFDEAALDQLFQQAHRLAGSASIYRLDPVSDAAGRLESALMELREARLLPPDVRARLAELITELKNACSRATDPLPRRRSGARNAQKRPGS